MCPAFSCSWKDFCQPISPGVTEGPLTRAVLPSCQHRSRRQDRLHQLSEDLRKVNVRKNSDCSRVQCRHDESPPETPSRREVIIILCKTTPFLLLALLTSGVAAPATDAGAERRLLMWCSLSATAGGAERAEARVFLILSCTRRTV